MSPYRLKWLAIWLLPGIGIIIFLQCRKDAIESNVANRVVVDWNKLILAAEVNTEGYRGPVAARAYGYIGLAAYESAVPGLTGNFSTLSDRFPLLKLPQAPAKENFNVEIALNACYSTILRKFFMSAPENIRKDEQSMWKKWDDEFSAKWDSTTVKVSSDFGRDIAEAVWAWSATDSLGYLSNHHNYMRDYVPPQGEGLWVTSADFPMPPLLPYWGKVRPFVIQIENYLARPLPPYSVSPNEIYHRQALEIVSLSKPLSTENQWIADFWNDDRPGLTFSPSGHWLAITNQVIEKEHPPIEKTLETYLKVGFAVADAFISCFYSKYIYNVERPETYIQKHIDPNWRPFSPTPSFPSYPSGHSMVGATATVILTDMYGANYKMTDYSHKNLKNFMGKPRSFNSFEEMSNENAISRVFMGVHWRFDCDEGLRLGNLIGKEISAIQVRLP